MSKTTPKPANDAGSAREDIRGSGCGRVRTRGVRDDRGHGRGVSRHNQNTYRTTKFFKGNTNDMKDSFFQCYGKSPDKQ